MAPHNEYEYSPSSSALSPELVNSAILSQLEIEKRLERDRIQKQQQQAQQRQQQAYPNSNSASASIRADAAAKSPLSSRTTSTVTDFDSMSESQPSLRLPIPPEVLREQQRLLDQSSQKHQARRRSSSRNTPTATAAATSTSTTTNRQQSRREWQSKREALPPTSGVSPVARRAPQSPGEHQEWDYDAEAKRQTQIPAVAQALAAQQGNSSNTRITTNGNRPLSQASSRSNGLPNLEEVDVDSLVIERAAPPLHQQRSLRKAMSTNSFSSNGVGGDYIVEANPLVGAFHVVAPKEQQQQQDRDNRPPPSVIDPTPSVSEDQSTMTPQTLFSDEQQSRRSHQQSNVNGNNCDTQVPTSLSLPATLVGDNTHMNAPVARIRIVAASSGNDNNGNKSQGGEEVSPAEEQKSTVNYFIGGLVFFIVAAGGAFFLLDYSQNWMGFYSEDEIIGPTAPPSAAPSMEPTTMTPTARPTPDVLDIVTLPQYTIDAIYQQPGSAQQKAYHWLLDDIEFNPDQPEWKLQQRFALATLFYASNSQNGNAEVTKGTCDVDEEGFSWQRYVRTWLKHELDECQWQTEDQKPPFPYQFCAFDGQPIEALMLAQNCLIGYLPPEISLLTELKYVDLDANHLRPTAMAIPTEIGLLTQLERFTFYQNKAVGILPSELGLLTKLKEIEVSLNWLQGQVPSELGLLHGLEELKLRGNQLSGSFPSESWDLLRYSLLQLDVQRNLFVGTLPEDVINDALGFRNQYDPEGYNDLNIDLRWNNFSGTVPVNLCVNQLRFDCGDPVGLCGCDRCGECPA